MVSGFYSSENCCFGYQILRNNQFMPIFFNFIVFSNTQNFLFSSEHGVVYGHNSNWQKKIGGGGHRACLGDTVKSHFKAPPGFKPPDISPSITNEYIIIDISSPNSKCNGMLALIHFSDTLLLSLRSETFFLFR